MFDIRCITVVFIRLAESIQWQMVLMNIGACIASIDIMYLAYLVVSSIQFTSTLSWSMGGWTQLYADWNVQFEAGLGGQLIHWNVSLYMRSVNMMYKQWMPRMF